MSEFMQGFMVGAIAASLCLAVISGLITALVEEDQRKRMASFHKRLDEVGKD